MDTDLRIGTAIDGVEVEVRGADGVMQSETASLASSSQLPMTLGVSPSGDSLGPITVTGRALLGTEVIVERVHRVTLVRGETRTLILHLTAACDVRTAPPCAVGETCSENGCIAVELDGSYLPEWRGRAPSLGEDAGAPLRFDAGIDASGPDAGDGGEPDGGTSDGGPVPCGGPSDCDDGNPCTDDICTSGGCERMPSTASCDDGTFCNGLDSCADGSCSVHSGAPCVGTTTCDEAADRCTGCAADADCPGELAGSWSSCAFGTTCEEAGSQGRTVQSFRCVDTACVPTERTEMQACTRNTAGFVCATRTCSGLGACGGFADACATAGTQSQPCSEGICSSGACTTRNWTDTVACSRSSEGAECGTGTCGAWSECGGFSDSCDESGSQSRTCLATPTCREGACPSGRSIIETQACSRDTDGGGCGAAGSCGAWGACGGFADPCDMTGSQTRDCIGGSSCIAGACTGSGNYTDSQACGRATDGADCGAVSCTPWGSCDSANPCSATGSQSRSCSDPVCSGGTCIAPSLPETQGCSRGNTDGVACDDGYACSYGETCYGGVCEGFDECQGPGCRCTSFGVCRSIDGMYICAI